MKIKEKFGKSIRKNICFVMSIILVSTTLIGCGKASSNFETYKTYDWTVDNGDVIKVKLRTTGNYTMTLNSPFDVKKDDRKIAEGTFYHSEHYEEYMNKIKDKATILDKGTSLHNEYTMFKFEDEFACFIYVDDSDTLILLTSESEKDMRDTFKRMKISKE